MNGGGVIVNERHLFRGQRWDNDEWVTGDLVLGKYPVFKGWKEPFILNDEGVWEVDPATIGQCTGLRDSKRTDECPIKEDAGKQDPKPLTLALQSVQAERNRQDEKWGDQSGNHPFEWMSILGEEYGELCEAVNETFFKNGDKPERGGIDKMRKEAVQVAAVAVALIEALDKSDHGNIHDNPELVKEGNE